MNEAEKAANLPWGEVPDGIWDEAMKIKCINCNNIRGLHNTNRSNIIECKNERGTTFAIARELTTADKAQAHQSWLEIQELVI